MTYTEVKTINGKKYVYLRQSIRTGDKVIHKMVKYLGPVKPRYKIKKR